MCLNYHIMIVVSAKKQKTKIKKNKKQKRKKNTFIVIFILHVIHVFVNDVTKHEDSREGEIFTNVLSNKYSTGIKHHRFGKTLLPII